LSRKGEEGERRAVCGGVNWEKKIGDEKERVEEGNKASQNLERKEGGTRIKMKGENMKRKI
jgi:hypothetical protein